ncbi:MAG: hypothetical protein QM749_06015 [Aquabacterium sp.]
MPQPTRPAGPALSSFGWALSLSVCIHGALLGAWLHARSDAGGPVDVGHKRGNLIVQLRSWTPARAAAPHAAHAPQAAQASARPAKASVAPPGPLMPKPAQRDAHVAQVLSNAPATAPANEPAAPTPTPQPQQAQPSPEAPAATEATPAQPPSPPAAQPGARFANLFAPIISRPLGRGHWSAQPVSMPMQAQAAMQREQAIQGLRQTLQLRTDALRAALQTQPMAGRCEVRIALERQTARLQCDQDADQQRLMAMLGDAVRIQPDMAQGPSDNCLSVSERALQWQDCALTARP